MKRYNLLDGESYGKRYQMVEETNGDWVWYEDVEAKCAELLEASEAIVARWDSPLWKDQPHTGVFIDKLRAAIANMTDDEAKANARLIAAAPELLEALKHCYDLLARYEINRINGDQIADEAMSMIRSAIAKAKGHQL